jgi:hypothetical protein
MEKPGHGVEVYEVGEVCGEPEAVLRYDDIRVLERARNTRIHIKPDSLAYLERSKFGNSMRNPRIHREELRGIIMIRKLLARLVRCSMEQVSYAKIAGALIPWWSLP